MGGVRRLTIERRGRKIPIRSISCTNGRVDLDLGGVDLAFSVEGFRRRLMEGIATDNDVLNWLSFLPDHKLSDETISRWGLANITPSDLIDPASYQYDVKRIVCTSGDRYGWPENTYYASEKMHSGSSTFWPIDLHTLQLHHLAALEAPGSPIQSDVEVSEASDDSPMSTEILHGAANHARYISKLDSWCYSHRDMFRKIAVPGARGVSTLTTRFSMKSEHVFYRARQGECMRASIANAIKCLEFNVEAPEASGQAALTMLKKGPVESECLAHAGLWLQRNLRLYTFKNIRLPKEVSKNDWLLNQQSGVFVARIEVVDYFGGIVDHVVTFDATRRFVFDSMEKYSLRMDPGVLTVCVGDEFQFTRMIELKKLEKQPEKVGTRRRKPHKISKEKQRVLRKRKIEEEKRENRNRGSRRIV